MISIYQNLDTFSNINFVTWKKIFNELFSIEPWVSSIVSDRIISKNDEFSQEACSWPSFTTYTSSCNLDISLRFEAVAAASASEELVRALNKGYKSFLWPRYKPVTRQPSLSLKMTAPHQHASINQMHAASSMVLRLPPPPL